MSNVTPSSGLACPTYLVGNCLSWRSRQPRPGSRPAKLLSEVSWAPAGSGSSEWLARRLFRNSQTPIDAPGNREGLRNAPARSHSSSAGCSISPAMKRSGSPRNVLRHALVQKYTTSPRYRELGCWSRSWISLPQTVFTIGLLGFSCICHSRHSACLL